MQEIIWLICHQKETHDWQTGFHPESHVDMNFRTVLKSTPMVEMWQSE